MLLLLFQLVPELAEGAALQIVLLNQLGNAALHRLNFRQEIPG